MKNTNLTRAKKWLNSAITDIKRVLNDLKMKDFADVAFRSQFAVEKINKAILNLFAIKIEKVHNPSTILEDFLKGEKKLTLNNKTKSILKKIIADSKVFENEGTKTIYGSFEQGELITAEEIYDSFNDIKKLLIALNYIITNLTSFLQYSLKKTRNQSKIINELNELSEMLQEWI